MEVLEIVKNALFWPEKIRILKILVPILFKMKMAKTDKIFKSQKVPKRSKFFQIWKNTNKAEILIFSSFWKTVQKMWKFYKNGKYRDRILIGQKWKIENKKFRQKMWIFQFLVIFDILTFLKNERSFPKWISCFLPHSIS